MEIRGGEVYIISFRGIDAPGGETEVCGVHEVFNVGAT